MVNRKKPLAIWEILLESNNLDADLAEIYSHSFLEDFCRLFREGTAAHDLFGGVLTTAKAYLTGKQRQKIHKDSLRTYSGIHLRRAGIAARHLEYSLKQLSKSPYASAKIDENMRGHLPELTGRGLDAHTAANSRNGPSLPLAYLQELSGALSQAINDIYPLPIEDEEGEDRNTKYGTFSFVDSYNLDRAKSLVELPPHFALELASSTFRPIWECHSELAYSRGRYIHERGGYDSKPVRALFEIISKIDKSVPESLTGTAIEKTRKPKVVICSDF